VPDITAHGAHRHPDIHTVAGLGAAVALLPYVAVKLLWVVGAVLGLLPTGSGLGLAGWVGLNTATIAMALVGCVLGLALVRPWGLRVPAAPLVLVAWIGSGFLVAMLPYLALSALLTDPAGGGPASGPGDTGGTADPAIPGWEAAAMQVSFVGYALCLVVAVPGYVLRRWPALRLPPGNGDGPGRTPRRGAPPWLAGAAVVPGAVWLWWAAGGTTWLSRPDLVDGQGRLLRLVLGAWALVGAAAAQSVASGRAGRGTLAALWVASGSMVSWSTWVSTLTWVARAAGRDDLVVLPERPVVGLLLNVVAVVAGCAGLLLLRDSTRAPAARGGSP
jgi:hypothetical protein